MWMSAYICNWLAKPAMYLSIFLSHRHLLTSFPQWLSHPSATALSKRPTMVQMFSLINILNCLPPLIFVSKHICMRLTILTGSKNNHKIKVAETL